MTAVEPVFLDTSLLIAASVGAHPGHEAARQHVASLVAAGSPLCISPQICREFLVVLTRAPVAGRVFTVDEALHALEPWRHACNLLEENERSVVECLTLIEQHQVRGKQVHDCNIVAVMIAAGVSHIATRNPGDFIRYAEIQVTAIAP